MILCWFQTYVIAASTFTILALSSPLASLKYISFPFIGVSRKFVFKLQVEDRVRWCCDGTRPIIFWRDATFPLHQRCEPCAVPPAHHPCARGPFCHQHIDAWILREALLRVNVARCLKPGYYPCLMPGNHYWPITGGRLGSDGDERHAEGGARVAQIHRKGATEQRTRALGFCTASTLPSKPDTYAHIRTKMRSVLKSTSGLCEQLYENTRRLCACVIFLVSLMASLHPPVETGSMRRSGAVCGTKCVSK